MLDIPQQNPLKYGFIGIEIYIYTCISYNTGKSALPDIYAQHAPLGECVYIRQSKSACVMSNMLHFRHAKNLPKPEVACSASDRC